MKCIKPILIAVCALLPLAGIQAQSGLSWDLTGSISTQPYCAQISNAWSYGQSSDTLLSLEAKGERARAESSMEVSVLNGAAAEEAWLLQSTAYGRSDELLIPSSPTASGQQPTNTAIALKIRSLYFKFNLPWVSFTAGRQFVNFGRGVLWSPTDIFDVLDLTGLEAERMGSDALRCTVPISDTAGLDAVAAPSLSPSSGNYALRGNALIEGIDTALVAERDGSGSGWIGGADFKADLELSLYGEASYEIFDSGVAPILKAAGGADYSLGDFIIAAEYYYNGGGAKADTLFPGAHNLYGSLTWKASELLQISAISVWDISDSSDTSTLQVRLSAAQNATVSAFAEEAYGKASYGLALGQSSSSWITILGIKAEISL